MWLNFSQLILSINLMIHFLACQYNFMSDIRDVFSGIIWCFSIVFITIFKLWCLCCSDNVKYQCYFEDKLFFILILGLQKEEVILPKSTFSDSFLTFRIVILRMQYFCWLWLKWNYLKLLLIWLQKHN